MGTEDSHGRRFSDGDLVTFSGVQGMTELNGQGPIPVHVLGGNSRGVLAALLRVEEITGSLAVTVSICALLVPRWLQVGDW